MRSDTIPIGLYAQNMRRDGDGIRGVGNLIGIDVVTVQATLLRQARYTSTQNHHHTRDNRPADSLSPAASPFQGGPDFYLWNPS